jgi:hypothetical protein
MAGIWSTHRRDEKCIFKFQSENLNEKYDLGDVSVDEMIILR